MVVAFATIVITFCDQNDLEQASDGVDEVKELINPTMIRVRYPVGNIWIFARKREAVGHLFKIGRRHSARVLPCLYVV